MEIRILRYIAHDLNIPKMSVRFCTTILCDVFFEKLQKW